MALVALVVSNVLGEFFRGLAFCFANPKILSKIIKFSACSAIGQSFIFYTISKFDPLVCSTVTTTRKIFSVLLSIFLKGHSLNLQGWLGIAIACGGILGEMEAKINRPIPHETTILPSSSVGTSHENVTLLEKELEVMATRDEKRAAD